MGGSMADLTRGGHIELILGPMFAGKTSELMRRMRRYTYAGRRCLLIKYRGDSRYSDDCMATHDKQTVPAIPCNKLEEADGLVATYDCVAVDEGQFFPDLAEHCDRWANRGKCVVVAALDGTFQRKPFDTVVPLIPLAEEIVKLTAVCMRCQQTDAPFSLRTVASEEVQVIGGNDMYIAACRRCYTSYVRKEVDANAKKQIHAPTENASRPEAAKKSGSAFQDAEMKTPGLHVSMMKEMRI